MNLDAWDEVRTAYHVARLGTVSGAAEALGVHHATVIRHIDALENRLGAKLFQRHARGYTPTEAGTDLLQVAKTTDDQFSQLASRIRGAGSGVTGELIITSINGLSGLLSSMLATYSEEYPDVRIRYLTDERVFRLEYGEAHIAVRAGRKPEEPDNVVQHFFQANTALYATKRYFEKHGPLEYGKWAGHRFVGAEGSLTRAPFCAWMEQEVPAEHISIRVSGQQAMFDAVRSSFGIGFVPLWNGAPTDELVRMMPPRPEWAVETWLVTHVDLHRTPKVQSIVNHLREGIKAVLKENPPPEH